MGVKSFLLGKKDPFDAQYAEASKGFARAALDQKSRLIQQQQNLMGQQEPLINKLTFQLNALGDYQPGLNVGQQTNVEIERRRRALGIGQEAQGRNLQRSIAQRGLGNSAAGLFAAQRGQRDFQNQLADLESSRLGLTNEFQNQQNAERAAHYGLQGQLLGQRGGLLGEQNVLASQMQLPETDFTKRSSSGFLKKAGGFVLGGLKNAAGVATGALAGGLGAGAGQALGQRAYGFFGGGGAGPGGFQGSTAPRVPSRYQSMYS